VAAPDSAVCPTAEIAAQQTEDLRMWRNLVALLPYAVHRNFEMEWWAELERRQAQQRAAAVRRIPAPRPPDWQPDPTPPRRAA
jgi:hypothetical protein